jgi:hypothetical protein
METQNGTEKEKRSAHHRSPSYPVFSLGTAMEKAEAVYGKDKRSATDADVIASHLGYSAAKGPGGRAVSALKQYGLLEETSGKYRISDLGYTLIHFDRDSDEWRGAVTEAATRPTLFRELLEEYPSGLPSDAALRNDLLKRGFNPSAIPEVIAIARDTMSLASPGELVHNQEVEDALQMQDSLQVRLEDARPKVLGAPKIVKEILTQRVSPECMAQVVFDGPVSQKAVEKLIAYLELAKDNYQ